MRQTLKILAKTTNKVLPLLFLLLFAGRLTAQTTVNLTVRDTPDNQTWNNGTWSVSLTMRIGNNPSGIYTVSGGGGSTAPQQGALSATGTATILLPANANIIPADSIWVFQVCPQASSPCYTQQVTVATTSPQTVTLTPPSIRINLFTATQPVTAYGDQELTGVVIGAFYYNVTLLSQRICQASSNNNCTAWVANGGGGGGGGFVAAGDLSGSPTSQTVVGIRNTPVASGVPSAGQFLQVVGGVWTGHTLAAADVPAGSSCSPGQFASSLGAGLVLGCSTPAGGGGSGTVSPGAQFSLPFYTNAGTAAVVGPSGITTNAGGTSIAVPGPVTSGTPTVGSFDPKIATNAYQCVSSSGNDSNDGKGRGSCKASVEAALEALPGGAVSPPTAGTGVVEVLSNGQANCALWNPYTSPPVGLGFMGAGDPNYASPPNGWMHVAAGNQAITIVGVSRELNASLSTGGGKSCLTVSGTAPTTMVVLNGSGVTIENITFGSKQPVQMGYDSTGANTGGSVSMHFTNDAIIVTTNNGTGGPTIKQGQNSFQNYMDHTTLATDCGATPGSDGGANILISAGLGNTQSFAWQLDNNWWYCGGGVKYYVDTGFASIRVRALDIEAFGTNVEPGVWFTSHGATGGPCLDCEIEAIELQDYFGPNVIPAVRNEAVYGNLVVNGVQGYDPSGFGINLNTLGPMTILGNDYQAAYEKASPLLKGQVGFQSGHPVGFREDTSRMFAPAAVRFPNLATTTMTSVTNSGSTTVTTGVTAPDGTAGAARFVSTSGTQYAYLMPQTNMTVGVGDVFVAKVWARSQTANGIPGNILITQVGGSFSCNSGSGQPIVGGDGQWDLLYLVCYVTSVTSSPVFVGFYGPYDTTHAIEYYAPIFNHATAGAMSANEAFMYASTVVPYANNCPVATVCGIGGPASSTSYVPITPTAAAVRYAAPWGSNANDGTTWGTAKLNIDNAICALPGGSCAGPPYTQGAGTVYYADNTYACAQDANSGLYIMGPGDPNFSTPPTCWMKENYGPLIVQGDGTGQMLLSNAGGPSNNKPGIWLSQIFQQMTFRNMAFKYPGRGVVDGECSNNDRTGLCYNSSILFDHVYPLINNTAGFGPDWDVVGGYWQWFSYIGAEANNNEPVGSYRRSAMSLKALGIATLDHVSIGGDSGIRIYGGQVNGLDIKWAELDSSTGGVCDPVVWLDNSQGNHYTFEHITNADCAGGAATPPSYAVRVDAAAPNDVVVNGVQGQQAPVKGPMLLLSQNKVDGFDLLADAINNRQLGYQRQRVMGELDQVKRTFPLEPVQYANVSIPQASWIPYNTGGTTTLASTGDPIGAANATRISSTISPFGGATVYDVTGVFHAGDWVLYGGWFRAPDGGVFTGNTPFSWSMTGGACTASSVARANYYPYLQPDIFTVATNYVWLSGYVKWGSDSTTCELGGFVRATAANRTDVYGLVINYIPATLGLDDTTVLDYYDNLKSYDTSCPVGSLCGMGSANVVIPGLSSNIPSATDGVMYVTTYGNNSNNGLSYNQAKATIQAAENALPGAGGSIFLAAGSYAGAVTISKPTHIICAQPNGTPSTTITIPNASNANVITIAAGGTLTLEYCYVDGNRANQTTGGYLVYSSSTSLSQVYLMSNIFANGLLGGINFTNGGSSLYIDKNIFGGNGPTASVGWDIQLKASSSGNLTYSHVDNNSFGSNNGCISITSDNGAAIQMFGLMIIDNECQPNSFTATASTGISIVGNTTAGQSSEIFVRGNTLRNFATTAVAQNFIVVSNISNSSVSDNIIPGLGSGGTVPAIVMTNSNNVDLSRNNISNFNNPTGDGGVGIKISDAASTGNSVDINTISTTTTAVLDNGTGTLFAQWLSGGGFYSKTIGSLANPISILYLNAFDFNGPNLFFPCTAANTPPSISPPTIGGIFTCGPQSADMSYNVLASAWQYLALQCSTSPVAGHLAVFGTNYPCLADGGAAGAPSGAAGGALGGTYPNPTLSAATSCTNQVVTAIAQATAVGTCSSVTGAMMTNNTVTATQLAAQYSKLGCEPGIGDGLNAITSGTYLQYTCYNYSGVTWTITSIKCLTDNNGTSTLNATNGAGTGLLTGAVTCTNAFASGTQSATTTIASGDYIKFTFVSDGASKQSTWVVAFTQ